MLFITTSTKRITHEISTGIMRYFTDPHGEWVGPTSFEKHERRLRQSEKIVETNRHRQKIALGLIIAGFSIQLIGTLLLVIDDF